ncbi:hypothetical protein UK23_11245 [Lentzea aerocolonigenes]|uniref:Uncharacterized protein n=2 Tax=Lentzea aerocolonigenes TaxID=68170 RepID=A0A0F0H3K6_LENAE|nr:hypothetical protein UK23_11245 [Lentzea aerocolonigenes]
MAAGMIWAMSLPGVVTILFVMAVIEWVARRKKGGTPLATISFDELGATFEGAKRDELEHRKEERQRRDEEGDGAPPRTKIDLDGGTAVIKLPD